MKKKKILLVMTDAGHAHKMAANSLDSAFNKNYPDQYEIKTIDLLKEADVEPFNTSDTSYSLVSQNTFLDSINIFITQLFNTSLGYDIFRNYVVSRMFDECKAIIENEKPDLVISNHPITSIVLSELKKQNDNFKYAVVMLDLITFFRGLADPNADLIFAPTSDTVNALVQYGVNIEKIIYPIFPLNPKLSKFRKREVVLKELNLKKDKPVILITGGGLGTKTLKKAIMRLGEIENLQIIIITGKLEYFRKELERRFKDNENIRILGFVDNMQDYMNAADLVIGKPGATTIMELELFNKKAIFTKRVGHVEIGHDDYINRHPKFRYISNDWDKLEPTIDELLKINPREPVQGFNRSFDESEKIVSELVKLIA